jgi:uncharacterized BrkB/YihY/UPF0761 family membrane protein
MAARRVVLAGAAWLFLAGIVVQVFLAGSGLFEVSDFAAHAALGWSLSLVPILVFVLAVLARAGRRTVLLTIVLAIAAIVQPELAAAREKVPVVAALHPVNALVLAWIGWIVARRSTDLIRGPARLPDATRDAPPTLAGGDTG